MYESGCWLPPDHYPLSPTQRDWLQDHGSLTRRLTELSAGAFGVCVLNEGWQTLRADECAALEVTGQTLGWVREVYLTGKQTPWIFARSVASREALHLSGIDLSSLGSKPLGELLFCEPSFSRSPLQVCPYPALFLPQRVRHDGLWARRSCFQKNQLGILVVEVFLPALWQSLTPPRKT